MSIALTFSVAGTLRTVSCDDCAVNFEPYEDAGWYLTVITPPGEFLELLIPAAVGDAFTEVSLPRCAVHLTPGDRGGWRLAVTAAAAQLLFVLPPPTPGVRADLQVEEHRHPPAIPDDYDGEVTITEVIDPPTGTGTPAAVLPFRASSRTPTR